MTHVIKIIGEEGVSGLKQDLHQDMVQKDAWGVQNKLAKDLNPTEMLWVNQAVHARKLTTVAHLAELAAHMRKTCRGLVLPQTISCIFPLWLILLKCQIFSVLFCF